PHSPPDALARGAGLQVLHEVRPISGISAVSGPVSGNLPGGATGAISQFDRVENDSKTAEHGGLIFTPEAQTQYVDFFKSFLAGSSVIKTPHRARRRCLDSFSGSRRHVARCSPGRFAVHMGHAGRCTPRWRFERAPELLGLGARG